MDLTTLLIGSVGIFGVVYIYKWIRNHLNYFKDRGVPYVPTVFPFGSNVKGVFLKEHMMTAVWNGIYKKLDGHKIGGFYNFIGPTYMVIDPEYANQVSVQHHSHFVDRGFMTDEKVNPLEGHLFLLRGAKWRFMRNKLSPIFTSGKLKWMFTEMEKCVDVFLEHFENAAGHGQDIAMKEHFARLTADVIASCAFGLDIQSVRQTDSKFFSMSQNVFKPSIRNALLVPFRLAAPHLYLRLKLKTFPQEVEDFFISITKQAFEMRKTTGTTRTDFIELLRMLKEKGTAEISEKDDEREEMESFDGIEKESETLELTDELLTAQLFVFFVAGFETTSSTLNSFFYLTAHHSDVQDKVRGEVQKVLAKHGKFTYDALKEMVYLDNCINETLRMFPPVPALLRVCNKDYTFPDGTTLRKGEKLVIPVYSFHTDSKLFPNPYKFDPDRFDGPIQRGSYSPFGDGPRICIGKRFALVELKLVIARLVTKYEFTPSPLCPYTYPVKMVPSSFLLRPKNTFRVKVKKID